MSHANHTEPTMSATTIARLADAEHITGPDADGLFLAAIAGAAADSVEHVATLRDADGWTFVRTAGDYDDGQTCEGIHVRDDEGEFVEFIPTPAGMIAWKFADPTEDARWICDEDDLRAIKAEDPSLIVEV